jgi:hypothetical protein
MRTLLRLEPFEIVDLIPLVLDLRFRAWVLLFEKLVCRHACAKMEDSELRKFS